MKKKSTHFLGKYALLLETKQNGTRVNKSDLISFGGQLGGENGKMGRGTLACRALDQANLIAVHALEGHEFGGKVVSMDRLLGAIARGAGQQSIASAGLAGVRRCQRLNRDQGISFRLQITDDKLKLNQSWLTL